MIPRRRRPGLARARTSKSQPFRGGPSDGHAHCHADMHRDRSTGRVRSSLAAWAWLAPFSRSGQATSDASSRPRPAPSADRLIRDRVHSTSGSACSILSAASARRSDPSPQTRGASSRNVGTATRMRSQRTSSSAPPGAPRMDRQPAVPGAAGRRESARALGVRRPRGARGAAARPRRAADTARASTS